METEVIKQGERRTGQRDMDKLLDRLGGDDGEAPSKEKRPTQIDGPCNNCGANLKINRSTLLCWRCAEHIVGSKGEERVRKLAEAAEKFGKGKENRVESKMMFLDKPARTEKHTLSEQELNRELDEPLRNPEEFTDAAVGAEALLDAFNRFYPGYGYLMEVLDMALQRAAIGKGKERHANGKPFLEQPIVTEALLLGINGNVQQIRKKALEATKLPTTEAKVNELLDVIVYAAATVIVLRLEAKPC